MSDPDQIGVAVVVVTLLTVFVVGLAAVRAWEQYRDRFRPRF